MNWKILFNPYGLIERLAASAVRKKRLYRLKNTAGHRLQIGHIDSLELIELIKGDSSLRADMIIFDIGSNIGTWTLLAKAVLPYAVIHACEPLKIHTDKFRLSCQALADVHLHEYCAGNQNAFGNINISSYSDASSLLASTPLEFKDFHITKEREEKVEIKKISDLIRQGELPVPDIIKLDVQGFELEVLKGIGHYLNSVRYVICEVSFKEYYYDQPQFLDIANYLALNNLKVFAFSKNTPVGGELSQIDVLFKQNKA